MIIIYRPELDNPPIHPEATISFSFIPKLEDGTKIVKLSNGVTRDFPENVWEIIKEYDVVKGLLSRGALRIEEDSEVIKKEEKVSSDKKEDSISNFTREKAMSFIEDSFDIDQLKRWDKDEKRIPIKNAIAKRIDALIHGKG